MATRVVLDTNVLISGLLYRGRPHLCLRTAAEGLVRSTTSEFILSEFTEKLMGRFGFDPKHAQQAVALIRRFSQVVSTTGTVKGASTDPKDDPILETAGVGRADMIVTGDKQLLGLSPFRYQPLDGPARRIDILTPAHFILAVASS